MLATRRWWALTPARDHPATGRFSRASWDDPSLFVRTRPERKPSVQGGRVITDRFKETRPMGTWGERRGVSPTCAAKHVGLTPRRSPDKIDSTAQFAAHPAA